MAVSTLYFYQAALKAGPGKMKFEVISMMVTGIATVLYMTMFSGAGKSFVKELGHDINPHDTRDAFYWGRYVDWILTTPVMLWTCCQSSLEIHHRQHCWKGSTKPLLQSSILDYCALDSLPTRLDRL